MPGSTVSPTPSFSPLPSPSVALTLPATVQESLCQHLAQVRQTLATVQASPSIGADQVQAALASASSGLKSDEAMLGAANQPALASVVQSVATAIDTLNGSIPSSGKLPSGIQSGLAIVTGALAQLPPTVCPSPTA